MIEISETAFPNNVVLLLRDKFLLIDPPIPDEYDGIPVFTRPLRNTDPQQCIGITAAMWTPEQETEEMLGQNARTGSTVNNYLFGIQAFVKQSQEDLGLQLSSTLSGVVKNTLTLDLDVRQALGMLTSTEFGYTERFTKGTVFSQRYMNNELNGTFLFLSNLEYIVQTEITA